MRPSARRIWAWMLALLGGIGPVMPGMESAAHAVEGPAPVTLPLWGDGPTGVRLEPPGMRPTLTLHQPPPAKATGAVVVVCPGGGYGMLAGHEAEPIAEWLNGLGITAVILRYRLGPAAHHPAMLDDAARAIRTVRANANAWKVDPARVAILGFSAGGHLASTAGTHFDTGNPAAADPLDRPSSRPDRLILIYPVISMREPLTHARSKRNLLGANPPAELVENLSNETQVRPDTPPTFLAQTDEDTAVPAENALLFTMALRRNKVPVELHLFEKGRHGLGLGRDDLPFSEWPQLCARWLDGQGYLKVQP